VQNGLAWLHCAFELKSNPTRKNKRSSFFTGWIF
jgi:hypothetical protein